MENQSNISVKKSDFLNRVKKTRSIGLLAIVGIILGTIAFIGLYITLYAGYGGFRPYRLNGNSYIYSEYESLGPTSDPFIQRIIAFGVLFGIALIYDLIVKILYTVKIVRLQIEKFKTWQVLLIAGCCGVPFLYFIAWIYTLIELKNMIKNQTNELYPTK
ncbi:hypothetical protein [Ureaplasma zalophigenitalium]|uniref:DUF4234 domain-containing protein n=1 Tax=Ureaplasma zalophigenitalium TaxID=907723 RepID=A0ABT3BPE8_9BACT|nr:hypothetical protein [Ureaplasma zalophigenitalium]MCV3754109.1 hypothetical protein [Ureaplasma zalophigenitalium]